MIHYRKGNILSARVEGLVNPVNTVGTMGKGLALQFKQAYPYNYSVYHNAARAGKLKVGDVLVVRTEGLYIINFPTKQHWRDPSKLEWIIAGLHDLRAKIVLHNIQSIAIPALGCGLGGLKWEDVKMVLESELGQLNINIFIFEPPETASPV